MNSVRALRAPSLSRRSFLVACAASGGGLMIGWAPAADATGEDVFAPDAFIRLDRAGKITVISPAVEMGQGTYTSLSMLIAEELDVDMANISVDHAPPNDKLYGNPIISGVQMTGGSTTIRAFYLPLRKAGAAAREMLIAAAASALKVEASTLSTEPGYVIHTPSGKKIAYGDLADAAAALPVPVDVKLKDPSKFRIIGTSAKRLDVSGKVNGSAVYGIDVKLPDMKIATVQASPVFGGKVASFDEAAALKVPGVRQVAKIDDAVAVIADHFWAAKQGLEAADVKFDDGPNAALTTADIVADLAKAAEHQGGVARNDGDAADAFSKAPIKIEAVYEAPFLAHATMEPINCTVHVTPDGCDIWVGTQVPTRAQSFVAKALNIPLENVQYTIICSVVVSVAG